MVPVPVMQDSVVSHVLPLHNVGTSASPLCCMWTVGNQKSQAHTLPVPKHHNMTSVLLLPTHVGVDHGTVKVTN